MIENNKWYKHKIHKNILIFFTESKFGKGYGISEAKNWRETGQDIWFFNEDFKELSDCKNWYLASKEEIENTIKEEAIRRGYKPGITIDQNILNNPTIRGYNIIPNIFQGKYHYTNCNYQALSLNGKFIFYNGIWAPIIKGEEKEIESKYSYTNLYTISEDKSTVLITINQQSIELDAEAIEEIYNKLN